MKKPIIYNIALGKLLIGSVIIFTISVSAYASWGGAPRNLPPYDYIQDGDLVKSCKLLLMEREPESDWWLCKHYMQGFMDAKLADKAKAGEYCVPHNFRIEDAIKAYIDNTEDLRSTSLYYKTTPATRPVNRWFDEYFACQDREAGPE